MIVFSKSIASFAVFPHNISPTYSDVLEVLSLLLLLLLIAEEEEEEEEEEGGNFRFFDDDMSIDYILYLHTNARTHTHTI